MGDAWDDDEFEVSDLNGGFPPPVSNWDDEEEFEPPPLPGHGEAPKLSAEKQAKLKNQQNAKKRNDLESALQEEETDDERRLRERLEIENADHELTDDLFGGGAKSETVVKIVQGVEGYSLKSLKDHLTLAHDVIERVENNKSKQNYIHAMLKEFVKKFDDHLTPGDLGEIIGICNASKIAKEKLLKQPTAKKGQGKKKNTGTKKEVKKEVKQHEEMFGGFVEDEYEDFTQEYDDFM